MATQPILIAGAGPTGMTAALELSRFGIPVRIIDLLPQPRTTSRALAVQARTLELFEQRGLSGRMVDLGNPARAVTLHDGTKQLADIPFAPVESRYNYILMLSQAETEQLLREQLAAQGVTVERPVELIAVAQVESHEGPQQGNAIRAILKHADGTLEQVDAPYLISGEGAHSVIRHTLDLPFTGSAITQRFLLADVHIDGPVPDDRLSMFLSGDDFLGLFPMGSDHFRVIATQKDPAHDVHASIASSDDSATQTKPDPTLEEVQVMFDRVTGITARLHDMVWSSWFKINTRMVSSLRAGSLFLGGDSAHVHSPAGGQGMNTGIQDMIDLGWKLAMVLGGKASPKLLDTYDEDRLPVIHQVLEVSEKMTEIVATGGPLAHAALTHIGPLLLGTRFFQGKGIAQLSQIAFNYRESSLSKTDARPGSLHAGDRAPEISLVAHTASSPNPQPKRLLELLNPSRFTLLVHRGARAEPVGDLGLEPWSSLLDRLDISPDPARLDAFHELFGRDQGFYLVRPDAYLGFVGGSHSAAALRSWLTHWFPAQTTPTNG